MTKKQGLARQTIVFVNAQCPSQLMLVIVGRFLWCACRVEMYLNVEGFLKTALKSTGKLLLGLETSFKISAFCRNQHLEET